MQPSNTSRTYDIPDLKAPDPSDPEATAPENEAGATLPSDFPRSDFTPDQLDTLEHYYHSHLPQLASQLLTSLKNSPKGEATLEQIGVNVHLLTQALGLEPLPPLSFLASAVRTRKDTLLKQRRHLLYTLSHNRKNPQKLTAHQLARALRTTARMLTFKPFLPCQTKSSCSSSSSSSAQQ